jgi:hypothetical protein
MGRSALILALAAAVWGCPSSGHITINLQPDGGPVCGGDPLPGSPTYGPCDVGLTCVNRICTPNCGAGCAAGTYCEGLPPRDICAPVQPIACTKNLDCPNPQGCFNGLCASVELRADGGYQPCIPNSEPDDGCGADALCYVLVVSGGTIRNTCVGLPACGQNGSCPAAPSGGYGSVCNDGRNPDGGQLMAGKQRICLFGYCTIDGDCDRTARCFFGTPTVPGKCQYGSAGDPCFTNADCLNSAGCGGADGGLLDGGSPGTCHT